MAYDATRRARIRQQRVGAARSRKPAHELAITRDIMWEELQGDAKAVSKQLFGEAQPDTTHLTREEYADLVRRGYERDDRKWLAELAKTDPDTFLRAIKDIGIVVPPEDAPPPPMTAPVLVPPTPGPMDAAGALATPSASVETPSPVAAPPAPTGLTL